MDRIPEAGCGGAWLPHPGVWVLILSMVLGGSEGLGAQTWPSEL